MIGASVIVAITGILARVSDAVIVTIIVKADDVGFVVFIISIQDDNIGVVIIFIGAQKNNAGATVCNSYNAL